MKRLALALALVFASTPLTAGAEAPRTVRVQTREGRITGMLVAIREGRVELDRAAWQSRPGEAPRAIPLADVLSLEVLLGHTSRRGAGRLVGAAGGLIAGVAWASRQKDGLAAGILSGVVLFTAGGAVAGGAIGSTLKREAWQAIPFDKTGSGVAFSPRPAFVKLTLRF